MYATNTTNLPTLEQIDDFGLTPNQFRVYCRLLRLAEDEIVSVSVDNLVRVCRLNRATVIKTLEQLEKLGLIECDRSRGKRNIFYLMHFSNWHKNQIETEEPKQIPTSTYFKLVAEPVPTLNWSSAGDSRNPPKGGSVESCCDDTEQPVPETNQSNLGTGSVEANNVVQFVKPLSLDEKLEAARKMGLNAGIGYTELNQKVVRVDGKQISETEFLDQPLSSFVEQFRPATDDELASCRAQIERIKAKQKRF